MRTVSLKPAPVTLEALEDRLALQQLAWAYCHAIDRRDFILLRSLYHDDAIDDHGSLFCGSPDEYVAWLPSMLANWSATAHLIHNMLFLIDGEQAEGELCATAYHRAVDGTREFIGHGRYLDEYRRRDGVWRIFRRTLVVDWEEERRAGPAPAAGLPYGRASDGDPVFERLPMFAAQR